MTSAVLTWKLETRLPTTSNDLLPFALRSSTFIDYHSWVFFPTESKDVRIPIPSYPIECFFLCLKNRHDQLISPSLWRMFNTVLSTPATVPEADGLWYWSTPQSQCRSLAKLTMWKFQKQVAEATTSTTSTWTVVDIGRTLWMPWMNVFHCWPSVVSLEETLQGSS